MAGAGERAGRGNGTQKARRDDAAAMAERRGNYDPAGGRKLVECVREAARTRRYSHRTEETYCQWIRRYILFFKKRHPRAGC